MAKSNKSQIPVTWLSYYTCKGINFRLGDNGSQLFYEAKRRGIYWLVLRVKPLPSWVVMVKRNGCLRTLNAHVQHGDGTVDIGPLWDEKGHAEDVPVDLIHDVADYIQSGKDPFAKNEPPKTYKIPCVWQNHGYYEIKAFSLEDAIDLAYERGELPKDSEYIEDSLEIDFAGIEIAELDEANPSSNLKETEG